MIAFDSLVLRQVQSRLSDLSTFSKSISADLSQSRGMAAEQERETLRLLNELCSRTLPILFQSSSQLLSVIAQQAQDADAKASAAFEG